MPISIQVVERPSSYFKGLYNLHALKGIQRVVLTSSHHDIKDMCEWCEKGFMETQNKELSVYKRIQDFTWMIKKWKFQMCN